MLFALSALALLLLAARGARAQPPMSVAVLRDIAEAPCRIVRDSSLADSLTRRARLASVDSTALPCASAQATPVAKKRSVLPMVFVAGLGAGLVANRFAHLDADPGGYTDSWTNKATYPKKIVHGTIAFALTSMGVDLKMRPMMSALTVCGAGIAYEYTQGYVSRLDIGADCIGASASALWRSWVDRR